MKNSRAWIGTGAGIFLAALFLLGLVQALQSASHQSVERDLRENSQIVQQTQLRINEFMADNEGVLIDPADGKNNEDWIEIYNPTGQTIDLQGLYITDSLSDKTKHAITQSLTIPANGYLILWADDESYQGANHLAFKLNATAEAIALIDSDGISIIDSVIYGEQQTNVSYGRIPDGESGQWQPLSAATPGTSNISAPVISTVTVEPPIPLTFQPVEISTTITDNLGIVSVSLVYSITDESGIQTASPVTIPVNLVGVNQYSVQVPGQSTNSIVWFQLIANDIEGGSSRYPSDPSSLRKYHTGYNKPTIAINEIMADNKSTLEDPAEPATATASNRFPDWFEIYNYGGAPVDLNGLFLSDDPSDTTKYEITATLEILPGDFLIIYADDDGTQGPDHTNFKLSDDGETLGIYGPFGAAPIDVISFDRIGSDRSVGRFPDGTGSVTTKLCVTPKESNINCNRLNYLPFTSNKGTFQTILTQ